MNIPLRLRRAPSAASSILACLTLIFFGWAAAPTKADITVPIEVVSPNTATANKVVSVNTSGPATYLYLQANNLLYPSMASVKVGSNPWIDLCNENVQMYSPFDASGGIGGLARTIKFRVLLPTAVSGNFNVNFRFNGTDGVASGFRIVDLNFLDVNGTKLMTTNVVQDDPTHWGAGLGVAANGKTWFQSAPLNENPITNTPLPHGHCSDCHVTDGYDLQYFAYSNATIAARAQFHGLSPSQAADIVAYIRSIVGPDNTAVAGPGRPWNPPYQPGKYVTNGLIADAQANPTGYWAAGAGANAVLTTDADMLPFLFQSNASGPTAQTDISQVITHTSKNDPFNLRAYPLAIEFPTWNQWLPNYAPVDMFDGADQTDNINDRSDPNDPNAPNHVLDDFDTLKAGGVNANKNHHLSQTFELFTRAAATFISNGSPDGTVVPWKRFCSYPLKQSDTHNIPQERAKQAFSHWVMVKVFELVRENNLEGKAYDDGFTADPEALFIPGNYHTVFQSAPHIISKNNTNFVSLPAQQVTHGLLETTMWYQLQITLNAGMRIPTNSNQPLDWDYQITHIELADRAIGVDEPLREIITHLKMYQVRDNGVDAGHLTSGFSLRYLHPWRLFSDEFGDRGDHLGSLETYEPGLANRVYEEFLREFLDVMRGPNFAQPIWARVPGPDEDAIQYACYQPSLWAGPYANLGEQFQKPGYIHAQAAYRLISELVRQGIDPLLVQDFAAWANSLWYDTSKWPVGLTKWLDVVPSEKNYKNLLCSWTFEDGVSFASLPLQTFNYGTPPPVRNWGGWNSDGTGHAAIINVPAGARVSIPQNLQGGVPFYNAATVKGVRLRALVATDQPSQVGIRMDVVIDGNLIQGLANGGTNPTVPIYRDPADPKFIVFDDNSITFPTGQYSTLNKVKLYLNNTGSNSVNVYVDNISVTQVVDSSADITPPADVALNQPAPGDLNENSVKLTWTAEDQGLYPDFVGHYLYRWTGAGPWLRVSTSLIRDTTFLDMGVANGVPYSYRLTSVDAAGNESAGSQISGVVTKDVNLPSTPANLTATRQSGGVTVLQWTLGREWDIDHYQITRDPGGVVFDNIAPTNTFTDTGLLHNTSYHYTVYVFDISQNKCLVPATCVSNPLP